MAKVSITDLAAAVSAKHGLSQADAEAFVSALFGVINNGLHYDKIVKVKGFGTFKVVDVRERESVNVNTGERVVIGGHGKVSFVPDAVMRDLVNKPFAKFETVVLNEGVELDELNSVDALIADDSVEEELEIQPVETEVEVEQAATEPAVPVVLADETDESTAGTAVDEMEESPEPEPEQPALQDETLPENLQQEVYDNTENPLTEADSGNVESVNSIFNKPEEPQIVPEMHVVADEPAEMQTEESASDNEEEVEEDAESASFYERNKTFVLAFGALFIAVAAFAGGYLLGQNMASRPVFKTVKVYNIIKPKAVADSVKTDSTEKTATVEVKKDTVAVEKKPAKQAEQAVPAAEKQAEEPSLELASRQVKTGAYVITGTSATITVKKGQTLKQLSKFYLGEGMECYIQVHNRTTDVKDEQKLRIPQLKLKKRK